MPIGSMGLEYLPTCTSISILKMIFLFRWWDMLVSWRVCIVLVPTNLPWKSTIHVGKHTIHGSYWMGWLGTAGSSRFNFSCGWASFVFAFKENRHLLLEMYGFFLKQNCSKIVPICVNQMLALSEFTIRFDRRWFKKHLYFKNVGVVLWWFIPNPHSHGRKNPRLLLGFKSDNQKSSESEFKPLMRPILFETDLKLKNVVKNMRKKYIGT